MNTIEQIMFEKLREYLHSQRNQVERVYRQYCAQSGETGVDDGL